MGYFYKYMQLRDDFFREPMLRATPITEFNDPFEGLFNKEQIINIYRNHEEYYKKNQITSTYKTDNTIIDESMDIIYADFRDLGIISFANNYWNTLMWSHYANEHRGVVIEFNSSIPLLEYSKKYVDGIGYTRFGKCHFGEIHEYPEPVIYRIKTPKFKKPQETNPDSVDEYHLKKFIKSILFSKSKCWSYEHESRVILRLSDADCILCDADEDIMDFCSKYQEIEVKKIEYNKIKITYPVGYELNENMGDESIKSNLYFLLKKLINPAIHLFRINPECIKSVYFGCRAEYEKSIQFINENNTLNHINNVYEMKVEAINYMLKKKKLKIE